MKLDKIIVILCLLAIKLEGQQLPQFTQYMINKYYDNPAYGGLERSLNVTLAYRDQYNELSGNPRTFYIGGNLPMYNLNGAVGFSLYNQKAGSISNTNLKVSYNYVLGTSVGFLSFGGRAGIDIITVDGASLTTPGGIYGGTINHNDPLLENILFTGIGISWDAGAYFMGKNIQAGITIVDLPSHSFSFGSARYSKSYAFKSFIQYRYDVDDIIALIPSILVKADAAVLQTDAGVLGMFSQGYFAGISLRGYNKFSLDACGIIIGTNFGSNYKLSYSYDFGLSALKTINQGSHEIILTYNLQKVFGMGLPPKIIYNPRDL